MANAVRVYYPLHEHGLLGASAWHQGLETYYATLMDDTIVFPASVTTPLWASAFAPYVIGSDIEVVNPHIYFETATAYSNISSNNLEFPSAPGEVAAGVVFWRNVAAVRTSLFALVFDLPQDMANPILITPQDFYGHGAWLSI